MSLLRPNVAVLKYVRDGLGALVLRTVYWITMGKFITTICQHNNGKKTLNIGNKPHI